MNANQSNHPWSRLTRAARKVSDDREVSAPYGFATRIAALAMAQEQKVVSLLERFAFRALGTACGLALLSVALNYSVFTTQSLAADDDLAQDDPVAVLLDT
jgi:hypothetical protein